MCCSTIKALRQQGRLDEALALARADVDDHDGPWENRSLFWVQRDICLAAIDAGDSDKARHCLRQMQAVLPKCNEAPDGAAARTVASLQRRLLPHYDEVQRAEQLVKQTATAGEAMRALQSAMGDGTLDPLLHNAAAWIIHHYLKLSMATATAVDLRRALALYFRLDAVDRPSLLHSLMLVHAVNLERNHRPDFRFTRFLDMWGLGNFRDEDFNRDKSDNGKPFPSLAEKAAGLYLAELKDDALATLSPEFEAFLRRLINRHADNDNLQRALATHCLATGRRDEAVSIGRRLALTIPQPYIWAELGNATGDDSLERSALCKAILMCGKDIFTVNYRLRLAQLLIKCGDFEHALAELQHYRDAMHADGYQPKRNYHLLMNHIPDGCGAALTDKHYYRRQAEPIENYVFGQLPETPMMAVAVNKRDNGKYRMKLVALDGTLTLNANCPAALHTQRLFYVRHTDGGETTRAVTIRPADDNFPGRIQAEGIIHINTNRHGKPFAFISDCYIGEALLANVGNGDRVAIQGVTLTERGKRRNIALSLTRISGN